MANIDSSNYWPTLQNFLMACRADKRITPHTQLVYRVLCDLANRAYWAFPFEASDSDLKQITHITSNDTINSCKRTLKNLGYIDYSGKPTKYIIYSPAVHEPVNQPVHSATPQTPQFKTSKLQNKTKKEKINKEKEGFDHDPHLRDTQRPTNDADLAKQRYDAILSKLGANG